MSKITQGMRLVATLLGKTPTKLQTVDRGLAESLDKAIQKAATYAMKQERARIYDEVEARYFDAPALSNEEKVLVNLLEHIEDAKSGAPTKGAVK